MSKDFPYLEENLQQTAQSDEFTGMVSGEKEREGGRERERGGVREERGGVREGKGGGGSGKEKKGFFFFFFFFFLIFNFLKLLQIAKKSYSKPKEALSPGYLGLWRSDYMFHASSSEM